jgi:hypothetical protein
MRIGIGITVPEISNLPGQSGGGGVVIPLSISYSASAFCANASDPTPTVTGNVGAGTYSSTAGLVFVSTSTGEVDISASTPSATAYVITYTDTNSATATFNLTINALDNAAFSYSDIAYRQDAADPTPTITGLAGGTFSGSTGLVINSTTGEIDLDASTIAAHTITYDTTSSGSSVCPNTSTQTVNVLTALLQLDNAYSMSFDGTNRISMPSVTIRTNINNSVSLWFKGNDSTLDNVLIGGASGNYFPYLNSSTGNIEVRVRNTQGSQSVLSNVAYTQNTWYHLVISEGSTNTIVYIDGVNVGSTSTITTGSHIVINSIGSYEGGGLAFNGLIDEVSFFETTLTELEVKSIYYATETGKTADLNDLTTPPVKWYRM